MISLQSRGLKNLLQHHDSKASVLQRSAFFMVQLSQPYTSIPDYWKVGLKLSTQKNKTMAFATSWQIDGKTMETMRDLILGGSKITEDGDYSHKIKRCLLLAIKAMTMKAMTNLAAY